MQLHGFVGRRICEYVARRYMDMARGFVVEDDNNKGSFTYKRPSSS